MAQREESREEYRELLSAELLDFSNKNAKSVSTQIKCSHVKIQRIDREKHRIVVVVNDSIEVSSCAIDDITQLHHIEAENCVKWSSTDDDNAWNLKLTDKSNADNFVRMVKEFSKLSLQTDRTQINETVHIYSSVTETDIYKSKTVLTSYSNQMPVKANLFTTPPTSPSVKSVFEQLNRSVESHNEAMISENDNDTDGIPNDKIHKPSVDDYDEVPLSPGAVAPINDNSLGSSVPTGEHLSNIAGVLQSMQPVQPVQTAQSMQIEIFNSSVSSISANVPSPSAIVPGLQQAANTTERSPKKSKPSNLPSINDHPRHADSVPGTATPSLTLSAGSERSTLYRGAACYFNSSRGADDAGYLMELHNIYEKYYFKMVLCYQKTFNSYWSKYLTTKNSKFHKVIAALICQDGPLCYTAVLSTGRYHNDLDKCGLTTTCDGHAISVCYEAAPKYFLKEIASLKRGESSVFELLPNNEGFKLRHGVSFHLFATKFPCGFIDHRKEPCMEWKTPFVEFPHVPTCSSRILIGATMGIQGYISHLLDKPIMIDSLVILCTDADENQILDFGNSFRLPVIKTMKYDPEDFMPGYFLPSKYSYNTSFSEHENDHNMVSHESTDGNETAVSVGPGVEGVEDSSVIVTTPDRCARSAFVTFNSRSTKESCSHDDFSIKTRDIDPSFEVDKELKLHRISYMKDLYDDLFIRLKIEEALEMLHTKIHAEIKKKDEALSMLIQSVSTELTEVLPDTSNTISMQEWNDYMRKRVEARVHLIKEDGRTKIANQNMLVCIQTILTKKKEKIIMDCSWHQYLHATQSSFQPTSDDE